MSGARRFLLFYLGTWLLLLGNPAGASTPKLPLQCALALVAALFESGAQVARHEAFGFHGTSVEALVEAGRQGKLPIGNGALVSGQRRFWYFYPNIVSPTWAELVAQGQVKLEPGTIPGESANPVDDAWEGAVSYAQTIAQQHRLLGALGLPINDRNIDLAFLFLSKPTDRTIRQNLVDRWAVSDAQLVAALREAKKARGVVLLVAPTATRRLPVSNAAKKDEGVRFDAPHGVELDAFLAVEPLGDYEFEVLEKLRP